MAKVPSWKEIDRLISEQKYSAALDGAQTRLSVARDSGDEDEWARALIKVVQLETGLHGYETSVRFLREQPWPNGVVPNAALSLFYAQSLVTYANAYSWEIRQREKVESRGPVDLKAWTLEQIYTEANRTFEALWNRRAELGKTPLTAFAEYLTPNNYPPGIRDSLRDGITYLWVQLLADTSAWRPEQSNEIFRLPLPELIRGNPEQSRKVHLADPAVHPLIRIAALLDDLEAWQAERNQPQAALEARLERVRRLSASFTEDADRKLIREDLEKRLVSYRQVPWWSMGQAVVGELVRGSGDLVQAREIAASGAQAYPQSIGGQRCLNIRKSIEAPDFSLEGMASDGVGKRSIQISHRNLSKLYFAAYRWDLEARIAKAKGYNLLGTEEEVERMVRSETPVSRWTVDLPATNDFQLHRTFAVPQLSKPGLYVIAGTADPDWSFSKSRVMAITMVISDLVVLTTTREGFIEATVVAGESGQAVRGAEVALIKLDWQHGHQRLETKLTDAHGSATFRPDRQRQQDAFFVYAKKGDQQALESSGARLFWRAPPRSATTALIYTDRSIYRPLQKALWKVVAYGGEPNGTRYEVLRNQTLSVSLVDANGAVVETKPATTNEFGSAAGEFVIPSGRVLGMWRISSGPALGSTTIRVEEYKRPTFEASFKDPGSAMRLNKPATLVGEAKYYFGLPVGTGSVRWRVTRQTMFPWWWGFGLDFPRVRPPQVIATGSTQLADDGTFRFTFTPEADERLAKTAKDLSFHYWVTADVTDEGGETRSASKSFRLGFSSIEAKIDLNAGFVREGIPFEMSVQRTNLDGVPRAGKATWRVVALKQPAQTSPPADFPLPAAPVESRNKYRAETPGDRMRPRWLPQYSPEAAISLWPDGTEVAHGSLEHNEKGSAKLSLPKLAAGAYRVRYSTVDEFGAPFETFKDFVVGGARASIALPAGLWAEKSSAKVGDKVQFFAGSGFVGQPMTFEVFRAGKRVEIRYLSTEKDASLIELPIREEDRGGFSVTLTTVRDYQLMRLTESVFVPWDNKELQVEFSTFRDKIRPGARESWRLTVKNASTAKLEAKTAELLAYMYDAALDIFAPHQPPSVAGLYPRNTFAGRVESSLGAAQAQPLYESGFPAIPPYPPLHEDQLKFFPSYGIGGPGVGRGRGDMALRAAAPMTAEAKKSDKLEAADVSVNGSQAAPPTPPPVELRQDFSETAFWQPQLLTDKDGSATIEFTVPDSVTAWNVWVHALTRDLRGGSAHRVTQSAKDLMVRPYVPRFLRENDQAAVKVVVNNASDKPLAGTLQFDIVDPETNASLLTSFSLSAKDAIRSFDVAGGKSTNFTFNVTAPKKVGPVAFKVIAKAGDFSDGELRPVPILPSRLHLVQSRFVTLHDADQRVMKFNDLAKSDDPTRINEQLVVTVDAQLFYTVLQSLPYLINYPYECTEQTLNRFLSTGIVSSLYKDYPAVAAMAEKMSQRSTPLETWDGVDPNRKMALEETPWLESAKGGKDAGFGTVNALDPRIAKAERDASLTKLRKAQTASGGFPWFPGGPPSPYMTLYLMHGFAKAAEFRIDVPKDVIQRAWAYLAADFREHWSRWQQDDCCWEHLSFLNYVASSYPDASYTGNALTLEERQQILDFSYKHWKQHSPYLKGYLALTLHRMGRHDSAIKVFDSVMDSAKTTQDEGTFWAREDRSWLWYNDTIETHAFALRTLVELSPQDARRHGLVQWLLLNKKLNHWKSTRATAEVIYALVKYLQKEGALAIREDVSVRAGDFKQDFVFEPTEYSGKSNHVVLQGTQVVPTIEVSKSSKGFAFASATWHFSTDQLPAEDRGDFFSISRQYFRREKKGREVVLQPLSDGAVMHVGDELEVQISIRSKHAAEYVHLRDPRAAGLEPENAVSRYKGDLGIIWYEETRDSGTNFFFEQLPVGQHTFKYRLRANMSGRFRIGPATLQSMYAPEFNAYSAGKALEVAP